MVWFIFFIYFTGWVTILSKWLSSPDIALSMLAGKALANLDLDFGGGNYEDGVHLYYPQHRFRYVLDEMFVSQSSSLLIRF